MVPVEIKINWAKFTVCGQCARQMGATARKEQRRRRLESEAVRGKKGQGQ
jgi:ribosome-binding protein aMBF1 (putative translation factor)